MKLEPARTMILGASLNLGTYIYDNSILSGADSSNAVVYKQNPEYRSEASLQLGSAIYLWLTVDSAKIRNDTTDYQVADTMQIAYYQAIIPK
jgi:hypothetical protein